MTNSHSMKLKDSVPQIFSTVLDTAWKPLCLPEALAIVYLPRDTRLTHDKNYMYMIPAQSNRIGPLADGRVIMSPTIYLLSVESSHANWHDMRDWYLKTAKSSFDDEFTFRHDNQETAWFTSRKSLPGFGKPIKLVTRYTFDSYGYWCMQAESVEADFANNYEFIMRVIAHAKFFATSNSYSKAIPKGAWFYIDFPRLNLNS